VFTVDRQDSMESLREAGGRRDRHELDTHGYKHVIRDVTPATPFAQPAGARRGRRRKSEELSAV